MRWGILATGNIAKKFAKTIQMMKENGEPQELVACASRTKEKAEEFASEWKIEYAFEGYENMIASDCIDAVYVATPNNMHYENCKMCLEAGKHVLCEKPFTLTRKEAEELYELAQSKNLFIMEGFWIRFLPALQKMQELIRDGVIGKVVYARSDYGFVAKGARRIRKFEPELGGGALWDIGIYNLGFMRMVMGDDNPIEYQSKSHLNELGTDDFSTVIVSYPEDRTAVITTCIGVNMARQAAIYGDGGVIYLDDFQHATKLTVCVEGEEAYTLEFPIEMGGFEYEIREVEACVMAGKTTSDILKKADTLDVIEVLEKMYGHFVQEG